jgi:hypothetical protein
MMVLNFRFPYQRVINFINIVCVCVLQIGADSENCNLL